MMGLKLEAELSNEVKEIRIKLDKGERLTAKEKRLEVSRDEAAYILTAIAGWEIKPDYIKQLLRGKKPRLVPARRVGNTYLYLVESLLNVEFTRAHSNTSMGESVSAENAV